MYRTSLLKSDDLGKKSFVSLFCRSLKTYPIIVYRSNQNFSRKIQCDSVVTRCWAFVVWVYVSARQKIPLSVLAQNPHKGLAYEIPHVTGRGRGKEVPRAVKRRRQSIAVGRTEKWTEQGSQQQRAGDC